MAPHIRSHRVPCSCFTKKASLQLSSEQSVGDVGITQLDWKRVLQASYRGCRSSVAITAECSQHHARQNRMNAHLTLLLPLVIGQNCYSTGLVVNSHRCTTITKQTHPASVQLFRQFCCCCISLPIMHDKNTEQEPQNSYSNHGQRN